MAISRARQAQRTLRLTLLVVLCSAALLSCAATPAEVLNGNPPTDPAASPAETTSRAVVHVAARASTCDTSSFGTGLIVAPQRVLAAAHVLAGADRVVVTDATGDGTDGSVVYFDPRHDLALIAVPGLDAPGLQYSDTAPEGGSAVVVSFRSITGVTEKPVTIESRGEVVSTGIYQRATVTLTVWSVDGDISPGDSGAPLVAESGILGLIFAEAEDDVDRGYALSLEHLAPVVERAAGYTIKVDTGDCLDR